LKREDFIMNGKERVLAMIDGKAVDHLPLMPITMQVPENRLVVTVEGATLGDLDDCVNSAFLGLFETSCGPAFQALDTQLGARHRGRTPTIHR
jgi:hypothetical protein